MQTRRTQHGYTGKTLAKAIADAHEDLDAPNDDRDPIVPTWENLTRMQREVVDATLRVKLAEHHRAAAEAKIGHDERAAAREFELADAYGAALSALDFVPVDTEDQYVPTGERLEADVPKPPRSRRRSA